MFYIILIFCIITDLITKNFAQTYLLEKINIINDFVYLQYLTNSWIAFWIKIYTPLLKIITICLIIIIYYYYINEKKINNDKILDISFWLIIWWAIWNAFERIFYSEVIDFIWIKYFSVFNLADSFISIWVILYLYYLYKNKRI